MCEFISWTVKDNKVYFLTDKDVKAKGWAFVDSVGHSAITKFYGITGKNREVPSSFPPKAILKEFQAGHMNQLEKAWEKKLTITGRTVTITKADGSWEKTEYDKAGKETKYEESTGHWQKKEYNKAGLQTKYEDSTGYWWKKEYNKAGLQTKYEDSTGYWGKTEYNKAGLKTKYENSTGD